VKTTAAALPARIVLLPGGTESFGQELAKTLEPPANNQIVVIDLDHIEQISPAELRALEGALAAADAVGARLRIEGARAVVYKALQVAKLAGRFSNSR